MLITNANIFLPSVEFRRGSVRTSGPRIEVVETGEGTPLTAREGEQVIDAEGAYLLPGFIDLHFHGAMGEDVCDGTEKAVRAIAAYELGIGVTSICPATMTLPVPELQDVLSCMAAYRRSQRDAYAAVDTEALAGKSDAAKSKVASAGAELVGVNMEGPFISPAKKGAQDARNIIPRSSEIFFEMQKSAEGLISFIGIAPEEASEESVADFIARVTGAADGFRGSDAARREAGYADVSLAHTNAKYDDAKAAFDAGANHTVHLYNAMVGMSHREPGCVGAAADSPHVYAELICDGIHIHGAVVRNTFRMAGPQRMVLISDSMRATGMPDGSYTLGGLDVTVTGKTARLVSDGAIAGSVTNLPDCVRTAVSMGIPLTQAVAAATINPARSLHIEDRVGSIATGKQADLVLWDRDLALRGVIKRGQSI